MGDKCYLPKHEPTYLSFLSMNISSSLLVQFIILLLIFLVISVLPSSHTIAHRWQPFSSFLIATQLVSTSSLIFLLLYLNISRMIMFLVDDAMGLLQACTQKHLKFDKNNLLWYNWVYFICLIPVLCRLLATKSLKLYGMITSKPLSGHIIIRWWSWDDLS